MIKVLLFEENENEEGVTATTADFRPTLILSDLIPTFMTSVFSPPASFSERKLE